MKRAGDIISQPADDARTTQHRQHPRLGRFDAGVRLGESMHIGEPLDEATAKAIEAVKNDMESAVPMDRLVCGDVGFGKTEIAVRAAFKAIQAGKQVAVLVPTTLLAAQHGNTFADRFAGYPIRVEVLSRFLTPKEQDAVVAGLASGADEVIIDTAGRLHTKDNLMEELRKVVRVIQKKIPDAPHRVLLVLDATLGQNALAQAREFTSAVKTTGVVLTKLDGSSKGGAAFAVSADLGLPVAYVGIGETAADLRPFSAPDFVKNLMP